MFCKSNTICCKSRKQGPVRLRAMLWATATERGGLRSSLIIPQKMLSEDLEGLALLIIYNTKEKQQIPFDYRYWNITMRSLMSPYMWIYRIEFSGEPPKQHESSAVNLKVKSLLRERLQRQLDHNGQVIKSNEIIAGKSMRFSILLKKLQHRKAVVRQI